MGFMLYVPTEDVLRPGGLFLVYHGGCVPSQCCQIKKSNDWEGTGSGDKYIGVKYMY